MKPIIRFAALAAGVVTVLGVRAWRENEQGKQVWGSATDSLAASGTARTDQDN
ncbi:hypothetical protein M3D92_06165 [Micrococcus terreus]|uniref:hypothetical protein n=1 Tax=Micrococcus terreus TaxID=574650 RepID=UPI0021A61085|nr:hypothetical protein [Micrococcus terreus]MCT2088877.1 hypothetical protein [Micrococcus terreus]MDK7700076.1 hypothetical protein [Micrococcus terreus]WOO97057.1 hypothetical protein R3I42_11160 [Micrococcus terreus]